MQTKSKQETSVTLKWKDILVFLRQLYRACVIPVETNPHSHGAQRKHAKRKIETKAKPKPARGHCDSDPRLLAWAWNCDWLCDDFRVCD
jgi:hypothetical protein